MNAAGYHWTNVILHLLGGLLLFFALSRMTASLWQSGLVAGLFLVHPLHVESVAWVAERKDVLSGLFWMLGIWCYARYAERPGLVRYLWVVLFFACGLLSKPMVVTFPFVLLLLDWWPLGRMVGGKTSWARLIWEKIPLFIFSAAGSVITFIAQQESHAMPSLSAMPLGDRLANARCPMRPILGKRSGPQGFPSSIPIMVLRPSGTCFRPHPAHPDYGHVGHPDRRRPYLLVGWLWYLGTLVPVIGFVQVGSQAMADRYTYLPLVGILSWRCGVAGSS